MSLARARALVVGVGGLGCPAALALARAGVGTLVLLDDDEVDASNLHRQVLYGPTDVGRPKLEAAVDALVAAAPGVTLECVVGRLLPGNAEALVRGVQVVVEGTDNFATKFLAADACRLAGVPIVHGAAVRWVGTALAVGPGGRPCYRCLFEAPPDDGGLGCSEAGVVGPVVGVVAAAQADLALRILDPQGAPPPFGELVTFDGRTLAARRRVLARRGACPLCGDRAEPPDLAPHRYVPAAALEAEA